MSGNAPPKETSTHIATTFLSRIEPFTATVPFSGTVSCDLTNNTPRFISAFNHHKYAAGLFVFFQATTLTMSARISGELKMKGCKYNHIIQYFY